MPQYDVFISYNRSDALDAERFALALKRRAISIFIDSAELLPGGQWRPELEHAVHSTRAVAVLRGRNGLGPTQQTEVQLALAEQSKRPELLIFHVILPGATAPRETSLVALNTYVDLSSGIDKPVELGRIKLALDKVTKKEQRADPRPQTDTAQVQLTTVKDAVDAIALRLVDGDVTFLIGNDLSVRLSTSDMAQRITERLRENDPSLPAVVSLDVAGAYYAVDRDDELAVETEINQMRQGSTRESSEMVHDDLAEIARVTQAHSRRAPGAHDTARQGFEPATRALLIVSTNFDVLMERALLRAGVSFRRIVQFASEPRLDVTNYEAELHGSSVSVTVSDYRGASKSTQVKFRDDWTGLEDIIGTRVEPVVFRRGDRSRQTKNPLATLPMIAPKAAPGVHVVLYKPFGSLDRRGSCAISCDHHYRFALKSVPDGLVPAELVDTLRNAPIIVLGYNLFDPSYRLAHHTLLAERLSTAKMFVVRPRPPGTAVALQDRVESALWSDVQRAWVQKGASFVDVPERVFLSELREQVSDPDRR